MKNTPTLVLGKTEHTSVSRKEWNQMLKSPKLDLKQLKTTSKPRTDLFTRPTPPEVTIKTAKKREKGIIRSDREPASPMQDLHPMRCGRCYFRNHRDQCPIWTKNNGNGYEDEYGWNWWIDKTRSVTALIGCASYSNSDSEQNPYLYVPVSKETWELLSLFDIEKTPEEIIVDALKAKLAHQE